MSLHRFAPRSIASAAIVSSVAMNPRAWMVALAILASPASSWAQHCQIKAKEGVSTCGNDALALPDKPMDGLGTLTYRVSTNNPLAQRFFDQGLVLHYAFNNEQAILAFRKAAELDPNLAMAYWGIALATTTNINVSLDLDSECAKKAIYSIRMAREKAESQAKANPLEISPRERDLINALSKRYPSSVEGTQDDYQLSADYALAMEKVFEKYPKDADVATLYADALMNLQPWRLWEGCKPVLGTEKIVAALKPFVPQNQNETTKNHLGANHFYIHAMEGSCTPGDAKDSAEVLRSARLSSAGHLVHMPSHIAMRTGDFALAASDNHKAVEDDMKVYRSVCDPYDAKKCLPLYVGHYIAHNLYFELAANLQLGRLENSLKLAGATEKHTRGYVGNEPGLEHYMVSELVTLARFRQWHEVLVTPSPDPDLLMARAFWHWTKAMALAATPENLARVSVQRKLYLEAFAKVPTTLNWGNNKAIAYQPLMSYLLAAQVAEHSGDRPGAIELLKLAVNEEDNLVYDEPNAWPLTVRETLGGAYLRGGEFSKAQEVFDEDLKRNPGSPRSLFGRWKSIEGQCKQASAPRAKGHAGGNAPGASCQEELEKAEKAFRYAWRLADKGVELTIDTL